MTCINCKKLVPDNGAYCMYCGSPIFRQAKSGTANEPQPSEKPDSTDSLFTFSTAKSDVSEKAADTAEPTAVQPEDDFADVLQALTSDPLVSESVQDSQEDAESQDEEIPAELFDAVDKAFEEEAPHPPDTKAEPEDKPQPVKITPKRVVLHKAASQIKPPAAPSAAPVSAAGVPAPSKVSPRLIKARPFDPKAFDTDSFDIGDMDFSFDDSDGESSDRFRPSFDEIDDTFPYIEVPDISLFSLSQDEDSASGAALNNDDNQEIELPAQLFDTESPVSGQPNPSDSPFPYITPVQNWDNSFSVQAEAIPGPFPTGAFASAVPSPPELRVQEQQEVQELERTPAQKTMPPTTPQKILFPERDDVAAEKDTQKTADAQNDHSQPLLFSDAGGHSTKPEESVPLQDTDTGLSPVQDAAQAMSDCPEPPDRFSAHAFSDAPPSGVFSQPPAQTFSTAQPQVVQNIAVPVPQSQIIPAVRDADMWPEPGQFEQKRSKFPKWLIAVILLPVLTIGAVIAIFVVPQFDTWDINLPTESAWELSKQEQLAVEYAHIVLADSASHPESLYFYPDTLRVSHDAGKFTIIQRFDRKDNAGYEITSDYEVVLSLQPNGDNPYTLLTLKVDDIKIV